MDPIRPEFNPQAMAQQGPMLDPNRYQLGDPNTNLQMSDLVMETIAKFAQENGISAEEILSDQDVKGATMGTLGKLMAQYSAMVQQQGPAAGNQWLQAASGFIVGMLQNLAQAQQYTDEPDRWVPLGSGYVAKQPGKKYDKNLPMAMGLLGGLAGGLQGYGQTVDANKKLALEGKGKEIDVALKLAELGQRQEDSRLGHGAEVLKQKRLIMEAMKPDSDIGKFMNDVGLDPKNEQDLDKGLELWNKRSIDGVLKEAYINDKGEKVVAFFDKSTGKPLHEVNKGKVKEKDARAMTKLEHLESYLKAIEDGEDPPVLGGYLFDKEFKPLLTKYEDWKTVFVKTEGRQPTRAEQQAWLKEQSKSASSKFAELLSLMSGGTPAVQNLQKMFEE